MSTGRKEASERVRWLRTKTSDRVNSREALKMKWMLRSIATEKREEIIGTV
ncbi:hypothetical protein TanjilG_31572 [Lupinus angustifolius]|uniref:Uncharacterized protein n=1 Tax=Lupinus angustifolius TaxID=3871 RepID=A0A1J7G130_LUPAN|nr:hypothetical protein TanjilG_31572 [Lupinus angustifolius]